MRSLNLIAVDHTVLPPLLLPVIKDQARVRHDRDDALITSHAAMAISMVERKCNISIDPATYAASPGDLQNAGNAWWLGTHRQHWALPVNNVNDCVVMSDTTDISANFTLSSADHGSNATSYLIAAEGYALPYAATLELDVGMAKVEEISPGLLSLIVRLAASHYENREAAAGLWAEGFADELMALWRPFA